MFVGPKDPERQHWCSPECQADALPCAGCARERRKRKIERIAQEIVESRKQGSLTHRPFEALAVRAGQP